MHERLTLPNGYILLVRHAAPSGAVGAGLSISVQDRRGDSVPLAADGEPDVRVTDALDLAAWISRIADMVR